MENSSLPYEIAHCSSWDHEYNPEQLAGNQAEPHQQAEFKGWQTSKYPEYPQDLIIHLVSGVSRISKVQIISHHFKIATTIDVYIGILKDPQDVLENIAPDSPPCEDKDDMLVEFTRLGFVCFENNARARYLAREHKSIKINADGDYIRLVIRNCHRNGLNKYNQVGILALDIIGHPLHVFSKNGIISPTSMPQRQSPYDDASLLSSSTRRTSVSSTHSQIDRLPSAAQDELQQWIEALLAAENKAAEDDSYQLAKTYKNLSDQLIYYADLITNFEMAKRRAVETKDYDEASKIKDDINEIKRKSRTLLENAEQHIAGLWNDDADDAGNNLDPIVAHNVATLDFDQQPYPNLTEDTLIKEFSSEHRPTLDLDPDRTPESLMDGERDYYSFPIDIFGEETVACVLSLKMKCREQGLTQIQQHIIKHANKDVVHATLVMMQEAVIDAREAIVCQAISIWQQIRMLGASPDLECVERAFQVLLERTSDDNANIRQEATELVLQLVYDDARIMSFYICKPERTIHNNRKAIARVQLVEKTVSMLEQVSLEDALAFVAVYIKHGHEDVRKASDKLLSTLSNKFGTHRVTAYLHESLKTTFKKSVDEDPSFRKGSATNDTLLELRALTVAQSENKSVARVKKSSATKEKKPTSSTAVKKSTRLTAPTAKSTSGEKSKRKSAPAAAAAAAVVVVQQEEKSNETNMCVFCNESNPEFNDETLIHHYYNECPVLTTCSMCQTITEIQSLNEHLLLDCSKKHTECRKCHQAIPEEQWLQHNSKQTCSDKVQCPLCLIAIEPANDEGWKSHLLTGKGCSKLGKSRPPNKKKPSAASTLKKKTIKK